MLFTLNHLNCLCRTRLLIQCTLNNPVFCLDNGDDLLKDFTVPQVAQKHGWPEPLVWSQALVNKDEIGGQHTYFSRITCAICL